MAKPKKIIDQSKLRKDMQDLAKKMRQVGKTGIAGGRTIEPAPTYEQGQAEKIITSGNNNFIILGRDRPGHKFTGFGAKGATQSSKIDLIAGMGATFRHKDGTYGPPNEETIINPNFAMDAARVYISQKSDLDRYMGLAEVDGQAPPGRSGIALKADTIRIHARQDIKIVTGRARIQGVGKDGERLSTGGANDVVGTISLIAGNYTTKEQAGLMNILNPRKKSSKTKKKLQPIPKGDNLIECLEDVMDAMAEVLSLVGRNSGLIQQMNTALAAHVHILPTPIPIPTLPPVVYGPYVAPVISTQASAAKASKALLSTKLKFMRVNHLSKFAGNNYINSKYVFTT